MNATFKPYAFHSIGGDSLTVILAGDNDYSEVVSDHITVYRSFETKEIVGVRVDGVSKLDEACDAIRNRLDKGEQV